MGSTCQGFEADELRVILEHLRQNSHRQRGDYVLFMTMLSLGGRITEILRLTWGDVWTFSTSQPRRKVTRDKLKVSKNAKIKRITGMLNHEAREAVAEWFELCSQRRKVLPRHYVFTRGGRLRPPDRRSVWRIFKSIYAELGLDTGSDLTTFALHSARKTFLQMNEQIWFAHYIEKFNVTSGDTAGIRLAVEFAEKQCQLLLGHSSLDTTRAYKRKPTENPLASIEQAFSGL